MPDETHPPEKGSGSDLPGSITVPVKSVLIGPESITIQIPASAIPSMKAGDSIPICPVETKTLREFYDIFSLLNEFLGQTDRGLAILGTAYIEELLKEVIESRFTHQKNKVNDLIAAELMQPDGALGSLDAKNKLALAMGITAHRIYEDIDYIRRIRNKFAHYAFLPDNHHSRRPLSFESQQIKSWCGNLKYQEISPDNEHFKLLGAQNEDGTPIDFSPSKQRFLNTILGLMMVLMHITRQKPEPATIKPFDYQ